MRILLLSFHWVEYPMQLANALVSRGHDVTLVLSSIRVAETVGAHLTDLMDDRVKVQLFRSYARETRDPRQLLTLLRILATVARARPQILHIQEAGNFTARMCLPFWNRLPIVLTVHDVTIHPGSADSAGWRRREQIKQRFRNRADAVIVHGNLLRDRYIEVSRTRADRVYAIPHGCYHTLRYQAQKNVLREPGAILFFGRIELYKGLGNLIRVYKRLRRNFPGAKLIVAGRGKDLVNHEAELRAMPECELHKGRLSNEEVAEVFQRSSIVVLPYTEGSQSGVIRVAYPFALPVIATDVGSIAESIEEGVTGHIVAPGDDQALYDAIASLLADPDRAVRMGTAAREVSLSSMGWDRVARKQEGVFRSVLYGTSN